ncbi:hypothetical protein ACYSNR_14445 [Enterococcus sp. LJL128]
MFLTAEYKKKRDDYQLLKTELDLFQQQHTEKQTQINDCLNQAKSSLSGVSEGSGTPNEATINKAEELFSELQLLLNALSRRNSSIKNGTTVAQQKYEHYNTLYQAEKAREHAHFEAERQRLLNPTPSDRKADTQDFFNRNNQIMNPKW